MVDSARAQRRADASNPYCSTIQSAGSTAIRHRDLTWHRQVVIRRSPPGLSAMNYSRAVGTAKGSDFQIVCALKIQR
jgi:hypothetical protein